MAMVEYPVEEIVQLHQWVLHVLTPFTPVLFYLHQNDVESALRRIYTIRDEKWMKRALQNQQVLTVSVSRPG